jgi:RNA 3'-terminal phosphate cyclase (ATP)
MKHAGGPAATLLQGRQPIILCNHNAVSGINTRQGNAGRRCTGAGTRIDLNKAFSSSFDNDCFLPRVEGGGQVLRVRLAVGVVLERPLVVTAIRGRPATPGLGHQHSTDAKLVAGVCTGLVWPEVVQYGGHAPGISELRLWPAAALAATKNCPGGAFVTDTHTAGAVTLLLQATLPPALLLGHRGAVTMTLLGGTNVAWSPPIDHTQHLLCLLLHRLLGVPAKAVEFDVRRRGYYPVGRGEIQ